MLYSPSHQFIFVHIYKTGGASIVDALRQYCPIYFSNRYLNKTIRIFPTPSRAALGWRESLVRRQHMTAEQIRNAMPSDLFDQTRKFAIVRNPWDWQVSEYFYSTQSKAHPAHDQMVALGSFDNYIHYRCENDVRLQYSYVYDAEGHKLVDMIGKFENLKDDFEAICKELNVAGSLPHKNQSKRSRDWRTYYTDKTYDMVEQAYKTDIDTFGY